MLLVRASIYRNLSGISKRPLNYAILFYGQYFHSGKISEIKTAWDTFKFRNVNLLCNFLFYYYQAINLKFFRLY